MIGVAVLVFATLAQMPTFGTNAQDRAKAQALLGEGAALYERGDYARALDKFDSAYAAYPSSKILFNIGQANRMLGRMLEAREAYQRFLDEASNASPEDRTDARSWLETVQGSLAEITIGCQIDGAAISIDGTEVGRSPLARPVWIRPGHHQVLATKSGDCPMAEQIEVAAGGRAMVALRPLHGPLHMNPGVPAVASQATSGGGWWLGRKWTWIAAGSAVALTGAAALVGWSVQSRFDDLKTSCGRGSGVQSGCSESRISSLNDAKVTANVLWGLAAAAAVTTGALFFVEGHSVAATPMAGDSKGVMARVEF